MKEEQTKSTKSSQKKSAWMSIGITFIVIFLIVLVVILVFKGETTVTTSDTNSSNNNPTLVCNATGKPIVFSDINPENILQEYRGTFANGELRNIAYILKASYTDEDIATRMESTIHADYNIYMGKLGHSAGDYNANYAVLQEDLQMTAYAKKDKLDAGGAKFFQLDWNKSLSLDNIKTNYETLGYACETVDSNNNSY